MNPVQVRHVREAITERFGPLIDMSDWATRPENQKDQAFRSRALTALAVQIETDCTDAQAAAAVIDSGTDQGIDAIAVSAPGKAPRLWMVQTKWSDKGSASLGQGEALKFVRGMNKIINSEFDSFGKRFQSMASDIDRALGVRNIQITIVVALLGDTKLHHDVYSILKDECDKLNFARPMVEIRVLGLKHFHRAILGPTATPQINLLARLDGWNIQKQPFEAYYGTMSVIEIAAWYEEHGRGLFAKNIRDSLDLTDVNVEIVETLEANPERFWYFNNGITILCNSVGKTPRYAPVPGGPGDFELVGASVVNGAQTVAAIHRAIAQRPEIPNSAQVLVRFISLEECPEGFGDQVTQKTNTQNKVETRDFRALERDQHRLREDFRLALSKTYVIKRGEQEPDPKNGCSIVEAAVALACAHRNATYTASAKRDESLLWDDQAYHAIFGVHPNAYRVWRSVSVLRAVRAVLEESDKTLTGRASAVATYGDLLVAHIVFRLIDQSEINEKASAKWDAEFTKVPGIARNILAWLINGIDAEFGSSSYVIAVCRSAERSQKIADRVLAAMAVNGDAPEVPEPYRINDDGRRRQNAATVLFDSGFIPEGTLMEFRAGNRTERAALAPWLAENPLRASATWVRNRRTPLVWKVDGKRYSPTGLVTTMIEQATGRKPRAVQGPARWFWPGKGSLVELAERARQEDLSDVAVDGEPAGSDFVK